MRSKKYPAGGEVSSEVASAAERSLVNVRNLICNTKRTHAAWMATADANLDLPDGTPEASAHERAITELFAYPCIGAAALLEKTTFISASSFLAENPNLTPLLMKSLVEGARIDAGGLSNWRDDLLHIADLSANARHEAFRARVMSEIAESSVNESLFPGLTHSNSTDYFYFPSVDRDRVGFTTSEVPTITRKVDDLLEDLDEAIAALLHSALHPIGEVSA